MHPWMVDASFALAILTFMWKISSDANKKSEILFRRFDEFKKYVDEKLKADFVSKEMCHIMHQHSTNDFSRLEKKVDEGFRNIDAKMTTMLEKR